MPIAISILNSKGGSGKSTLATNIARALQNSGASVLIVDSDSQGTLRDWENSGEDETMPAVVSLMNYRTLEREIRQIGEGYTFVVIDGSAKIEKLLGASIRVSDLVLIPVQPTPPDIWGCADLVDLVLARREMTGGEPKSAFVISRKITGTRLASDVRGVLGEYGLPVLENGTSQRVAYAEAFAYGTTVLDVEPRGKASLEIMGITNEIRGLLNG